MKKLLKRNHGFTIIELIVVLAILAGIVVMLAKGVGGGAEAAKINQAKVDMNGRVQSAIMLYAATLDKVDDFKADELISKKYLSDTDDPWGEKYDIKRTGNVVKINAGKKGKDAGVKEVEVDLSNVLR